MGVDWRYHHCRSGSKAKENPRSDIWELEIFNNKKLGRESQRSVSHFSWIERIYYYSFIHLFIYLSFIYLFIIIIFQNTDSYWIGTWILEISDVIPGNYGDLRSAILTLHSFIPLTPPAPAPSPHPTPAPHPTPTPTRGKSNCCVYSYFADHDIKQCLTLGSTCHDLPNFVLTNTQYDVYDDECYLYCAPPVPTPTVFVPKAPTPTPVPSPAPTNCCVYKFVHDTKIQQCLPLQSACIDLFNWQLDYVMFNNDCTFCYSPGG